MTSIGTGRNETCSPPPRRLRARIPESAWHAAYLLPRHGRVWRSIRNQASPCPIERWPSGRRGAKGNLTCITIPEGAVDD
jgi:hypothetical protein